MKLAGHIANSLHLADVYTFLKRKHIGSQVVIITYHRVCPNKAEWSLRASVSPEGFEKQIEYLCHNYQILSLDRLASDLSEHKPLPNTAVAITLDDGYRDNYLYAYPILRRYGVPATIFLATGHIGSKKPFWWDRVRYVVDHTRITRLELGEAGKYALASAHDRRVAASNIVEKLMGMSEQRKNLLVEELVGVARVKIPDDLTKQLILSWDEVIEMSANGIDLGAHTVSHPNLTKVPIEQARREITQSKKDIEKITGKVARFFSYPGGIFNDEIVKIVAQSHFVGAVACSRRWITPKTDLYRLGRMGATEDFNLFKIVLSGLWGDLRLSDLSSKA
jgi:peptidoglycan/xylan/chitin deacetylase (PgdA/CDA1 family)